MRIGLLGASFNTGNLGVNALAESTINCILRRWPDAEITLLDSGTKVEQTEQQIGDRTLSIKKMPIRFCRNIFLANHFIPLCIYALLLRVFRSQGTRNFCARRNSSVRGIVGMEFVADITGGDSFSDIYGMRRFTLGFLRKWLILLFNKELILLPQTYGPFNSPLARIMARHIMKRTRVMYARDRESLECSRAILRNSPDTEKMRLSPDVAFALEARRPERMGSHILSHLENDASVVIGFNVSGLLLNGGYTGDNMFALNVDYRELVIAIARSLLQAHPDTVIVFIPHVFPPEGYETESDPQACLEVLKELRSVYPDRAFFAEGQYDQGEIKHVIGLCDFFIGSRMHSCIAALSQNVPAVALAYSRKFHGVFESISLVECVADARNLDQDEILRKVHALFEHRDQIRAHLADVMPRIRNDVLNIFEDALPQNRHDLVQTAT